MTVLRKEAAGLSSSRKEAVKWMLAHGSDVAAARVKGGGRILLAQGEHAPFLPGTARALIDAGLAEYVDMNGRKAVRFRLTDAGKALAQSRGNPTGAAIRHSEQMARMLGDGDDA